MIVLVFILFFSLADGVWIHALSGLLPVHFYLPAHEGGLDTPQACLQAFLLFKVRTKKLDSVELQIPRFHWLAGMYYM